MATRTVRSKATTAPVTEPVEVDDEFEEMEETDIEPDDTDEDDVAEVEDDDLEELEEEPVEEEPKPKAKRSTAKASAAKAALAPKFGSAELAAHITEQTGETYDARGIRMLLRKLAADGKHDRKVGETRDRYSFSGPEDPTVVAVLDMVKSGAAKALKQAGLEKVKADAAAKKAAKKAEKDAEPVEAETDEDEEIEEAPKPARRRVAAKPAAPAKAQPTTRRKATASK